MRLRQSIDFAELMAILSRPRPNGSVALQEALKALQAWLEKNQIPYRLQPFRIYPYFFECIGLWLIVSRTLLAWSVWESQGWSTFLIATIGLIGGTADVALHWPIVTWIGMRKGENILIEFKPENAEQEIVFSAHYDSKTELLDHRQRMFLLRNLPTGILLTILIGISGPLEAWLQINSLDSASAVHWVAVVLCGTLNILAWALGINLLTGRLLPPSQGAVDDGAACAILLGLAHRIVKGEVDLGKTRLTLALFCGEEVNMQGSRAYVRGREWPLPAQAVNLEVMAQDGDYVYWEQDGFALHLDPTSERVNQRVIQATTAVTGKPPRPAGPVISDGYSFLAAGIPTATIGTYDRRWIDKGFHHPSDNLGRVVMSRLDEGVEILIHFLR
jgi:hypothetical protein